MEGRESEREAEAVAALFALPPLKELLRLGTPRLLRALAEETPLERPADHEGVRRREVDHLRAGEDWGFTRTFLHGCGNRRGH